MGNVENMAWVVPAATEKMAATVVTAGKVEKVAKVAHFDLMISYRFYAFCAVNAMFLRITRGKRAARAAESGHG